MANGKSFEKSADYRANLGFEGNLSLDADMLRNNMNPADYSRAELDRQPKAAQRVNAGALTNSIPRPASGAVSFRSTRPTRAASTTPACGSGGILPASRIDGVRFAGTDCSIAQGIVLSEKFVEFQGGKLGEISIYVRESNATTHRFVGMSLALRDIKVDFGPEPVDTFRCDHRANPPFNDSDAALRASAFLQTRGMLQVMAERQENFSKDDDLRWRPSRARTPAKGSPPGEGWRSSIRRNAQEQRQLRLGAASHLPPRAPQHGRFVLANGSKSGNTLLCAQMCINTDQIAYLRHACI